MDPDKSLLLTLIRHIKDMYIILELYPFEDSQSEIANILEDAASLSVDWERLNKKTVNPPG